MKSEAVQEEGILDFLDSAVIRLDASGHIVELNTAATQCIGVGKARAHGRSLTELADFPTELQEALRSLSIQERGLHFQELQLNGQYYDCSIQFFDDGGALLELHNLRWELQRSRLQRSEIQAGLMKLLSRNLGHEIRNPLGGIRGAAQMLANELETDLELPELAELSRMIMRESDRIEELIARFGQPRLELVESDFYPLVAEVIELVQVEFGVAVTIERDFDPSLPPVVIDPGAVRQILLNLFRNACQAGCGRILLRTRISHEPTLLQSPSPVLRVDVEDDGVGVPAALRPLLFLPLMTGRRDGTGLGLALAQQVAAAHGGILNYEPRVEGDDEAGSRFTILLPILPALHE
ncbi:MAG TPA: ATP-binding protein [Xanthomonadales bacterium]|nr:ATP-binding protein [Xanthomonadales bacterium]